MTLLHLSSNIYQAGNKRFVITVVLHHISNIGQSDYKRFLIKTVLHLSSNINQADEQELIKTYYTRVPTSDRPIRRDILRRPYLNRSFSVVVNDEKIRAYAWDSFFRSRTG
jgi:hypothetical protein